MRLKIMLYLDSMEVKHALSGFPYLVTAIELCNENPNMRDTICKMYSIIAEKHNTTASRVERAIRHAIITSQAITDAKGKLTNSEFIAVATDYFGNSK